MFSPRPPVSSATPVVNAFVHQLPSTIHPHLIKISAVGLGAASPVALAARIKLLAQREALGGKNGLNGQHGQDVKRGRMRSVKGRSCFAGRGETDWKMCCAGRTSAAWRLNHCSRNMVAIGS